MNRVDARIAVLACFALIASCGGQELEAEDGFEEEGTTEDSLTNCTPLPVRAVTAIGHDGNVPANTLDNRLRTRWSHYGRGSWIQYDLGVERSVEGTAIAWYRGNVRTNAFQVSVSNDGSTFRDVFSGVTSGTTTAIVTHTFASASGRYVRLTVDGNSDNPWVSITEVRLCAGSSTSGGTTGGTDAGTGSTGGTDAGSSAGTPDAGSGSTGGGLTSPVDQNGVAYIDIPGFEYVSERFNWTKNFKSNGSMRHDFEGAPDSNQCVLGYFFVNGPDDEEISAKLASGPHSDSMATWADTYDIGILRFDGTRARLRYEATHPQYTSGPTQSNSIGNIRNKWVGAMGCKLNLDTNGDGNPDTAKILAYVDPTGLDSSGKPNNNWVKTLDLAIPFSEVKLKSPGKPYVVTIGHPEEAQATLRIDQQGSSYQYKFVAYRRLEWK